MDDLEECRLRQLRTAVGAGNARHAFRIDGLRGWFNGDCDRRLPRLVQETFTLRGTVQETFTPFRRCDPFAPLIAQGSCHLVRKGIENFRLRRVTLAWARPMRRRCWCYRQRRYVGRTLLRQSCFATEFLVSVPAMGSLCRSSRPIGSVAMLLVACSASPATQADKTAQSTERLSQSNVFCDFNTCSWSYPDPLFHHGRQFGNGCLTKDGSSPCCAEKSGADIREVDCSTANCKPKTCVDLAPACGTLSDGCFATLNCSCADAGGCGSAGPVNINFDSLNASTGAVTGAPLSSYFAQFGVSVTAGSDVGLNVQQAPFWEPTSSTPNLLNTFGDAATLTTGVTYTLTFSCPMSTVSFYRAGIQAGSTMGLWSATANSATDQVLSSVGENQILTDVSPTQFTLSGPGIASVTFFSNVEGFAGTYLSIDDLTITP